MSVPHFNLQIDPWQTRDQHSISALLDLRCKHLDVAQSFSINSKYQGHASWKEKLEHD